MNVPQATMDVNTTVKISLGPTNALVTMDTIYVKIKENAKVGIFFLTIFLRISILASYWPTLSC